jgi:hypothetical protein
MIDAVTVIARMAVKAKATHEIVHAVQPNRKPPCGSLAAPKPVHPG